MEDSVLICSKFLSINKLKKPNVFIFLRGGSSEGEHYAEDVGVASSILASPINPLSLEKKESCGRKKLS